MRNIKDIYLCDNDETMVNVDTKNPEDWNIEALAYDDARTRKFFRKDGKDIADDMAEAGYEYGDDYEINFYPRYYPEIDEAKIIVSFKDFTDGSIEGKFYELCDNLNVIKYDTGYEDTEIILTDDEKAELKGMLKELFGKDENIYRIYNEAKEDMKKEAKIQDISKD